MVALASGIRLVGSIGIVASVHLCRDLSEQGLFLAAELEVALPPMAREDAQSLIFEAERMCPYAKMARSGIRSTFILR